MNVSLADRLVTVADFIISRIGGNKGVTSVSVKAPVPLSGVTLVISTVFVISSRVFKSTSTVKIMSWVVCGAMVAV